MLLFELDQDRTVVDKIIVLTNQLAQDLKDGELGDDYTVDDLLNYFQNYDVILDVEDLYGMIKVPPLKDLIKNIQGDAIVFKGQQGAPAPTLPDSDANKTVAKMAKRAMK
jgi:hypothetical protein